MAGALGAINTQLALVLFPGVSALENCALMVFVIPVASSRARCRSAST